MAGAEAAPRKSDLMPRVLSAVVMLTLVGVDIWLGGWAFVAFVAVFALGVYWEWWKLARKLSTGAGLALWMLGGAIYIGIAAVALVGLRATGLASAVLVLAAVIAVDIGAYFAGRSIGGPKIAPKISPSKTWAGLGGAVVACTAVFALLLPTAAGAVFESLPASQTGAVTFLCGGLVAVVAQVGDFFESWMKRRAGVKDSGALIPGHGGLFDRVDGLIAVCFAIGLSQIAVVAYALTAGEGLIPTPA